MRSRRAISPKKSPFSSTATVVSPWGTRFLIATFPARMMYMSSPSSPSFKRTVPFGKCLRNRAKGSFSGLIAAVAGSLAEIGPGSTRSHPRDHIRELRVHGCPLENRPLLDLAEEGDEKGLEPVCDLGESGEAPALEDLDVEELEARPVPIHEVLDLVVVELRDAVLHPLRRRLVLAELELPHRLDHPRQGVSEMDRLRALGREVGEDPPSLQAGLEDLGELHDRLLEAVLEDAVAVLHAGADVLGMACHRDVGELGVDDLLELERHAVHEGVVEAVERLLHVAPPQHPFLDVREEQPRLRGDEREQQDGVAQLLVSESLGVRVLQVVEQAEELEEHLRRLPALERVPDAEDERGNRGVADAVVDGLELLVDQKRQEVAPSDLAIDQLPHRGEGGVRQPRELNEVEEEDVKVLEGLPEELERALRCRMTDELLDVRVQRLVTREGGLDVAVESREVDMLLGQDRGTQVDDAHERGVDEAQLLRPVPQGEGPRLALGQRLVPDPEEALEAPEPHLELEQLAGPARRLHLVRPAPELGAQQLRAQLRSGARMLVPSLPRHRRDSSRRLLSRPVTRQTR